MKNWRAGELGQILKRLDEADIVLISGVRGSGKTTLLKQVAEVYAGRRKGSSKSLYVDLEDPRLAPGPRSSTLDVFVRSAPDDSNPVLLDEVERVEKWADWAIEHTSRTGSKVVATASAAPFASNAIDGVAEIRLLPMSLGDYLREFTDTTVDSDNAREGLSAYLDRGGLPVAWSAEDYRRSLVDNFYLALLHDVLLKHEIRDSSKLTAMAVYLLSATSEAVSASHLKGLMSRSVDQARAFLSHLGSSGLVSLVSRLEDADRASPRAARRSFTADCGLASALSGRRDNTRALVETAVYTELVRLGFSPRAVRAKGILGLSVQNSPEVEGFLIYVDFRPGRSPDSRPLAAAMSSYGVDRGLFLTADPRPENYRVRGGLIHRLPAWDWLLDPCGIDRLSHRATSAVSDDAGSVSPGEENDDDIDGEEPPDSLPPHLL